MLIGVLSCSKTGMGKQLEVELIYGGNSVLNILIQVFVILRRETVHYGIFANALSKETVKRNVVVLTASSTKIIERIR